MREVYWSDLTSSRLLIILIAMPGVRKIGHDSCLCAHIVHASHGRYNDGSFLAEVHNSGVKTQQHCFEIQVSCANSRLRSFGVKSDAGAGGGSLWRLACGQQRRQPVKTERSPVDVLKGAREGLFCLESFISTIYYYDDPLSFLFFFYKKFPILFVRLALLDIIIAD